MESDESIFDRLRQARLTKGLTQGDLARLLQCSQSAISKFEAGRLEALSNERILALAKHVGVEIDLTEASKSLSLSGEGTRERFAFCGSIWCPSCIPFRIHARLVLWPMMLAVQTDRNVRHCELCGEPLREKCRRCDAAAAGGAFCGQCGEPWVRFDLAMADEILAVRRECPGEVKELEDACAQVVRWQRTGWGMRV